MGLLLVTNLHQMSSVAIGTSMELHLFEVSGDFE